MSLATLYTELTGRRPTDEEMRRLYVIAKHLGVNPDDDAIMALYAALEWYGGIFSEIPEKIVSASDNASEAAIKRINTNAKQLKESFDDYAKQSASKAVAGMVEAVRQTANKTAATNNIKWICICSGIVTTILLIVCLLGVWYISRQQFDSGFSAGQADARNTELLLLERDKFTKTPAFKLAQEYDKEGILWDILTCNRKGWKVQEQDGEKLCLPYTYTDGKSRFAQPWRLPPLPPQ